MVYVYFDIYKFIFVFKVEKSQWTTKNLLSIIIRICEFDVLYGSFCLIKFYILDLVTACKNKSDKQKIPEDRKGNVRRLNQA